MALGLNNTEAPSWANRWSEALNKIINGLTSVQTKIVAATTDLPPPHDWKGRQIWCTDILRLVFSDGVNWIRTDTGATI